MRQRYVAIGYGLLVALAASHCGNSPQATPVSPVIATQANNGSANRNASSVSSAAAPSSPHSADSTDAGSSTITQDSATTISTPQPAPGSPAPAASPAATATPTPEPAAPNPAAAPAPPPVETCFGAGGPVNAGYFFGDLPTATKCAELIKASGGGSFATFGQVDCASAAAFEQTDTSNCKSGKNGGHSQAWIPGTEQNP